MAALLLISTSHRGLLDWFSRTVAPEPQPGRQKPNGAARKGKGHRKACNGGDPYLDPRREARDRSDEALLAAMRSNPEGSIGDDDPQIEDELCFRPSPFARRGAGRE
jgi:hypothetical protein